MAQQMGGGNTEIDLGLGKVSEVTQEQIEQFQEQLQAAQAALWNLQQEEGRAKKNDMALAGLLSRFVKANRDAEVVKLIVYCLNQGIPVPFIIAVLSLGYKEIYTEMHIEMKKQPGDTKNEKEAELIHDIEQEEEKDLQSEQSFNEHELPDNVKRRINEWVGNIFVLSMVNKEKMLSSVYEGEKPYTNPLGLTRMMLEKYLSTVRIVGEYERLQNFSSFILLSIRKELVKGK